MTEFEQIYREHFDTVYRFLIRLCRNEPLAEELAQETFFRAMRSLGKFDGRCRVDVWLCQIAKNAYYSHYRKQKDKNHALPEMDSGQDVENALLDQEEAMSIYAHLHELDSAGKDSIIVICRMNDELPPATEEMEKRAAEYDALMENSVG